MGAQALRHADLFDWIAKPGGAPMGMTTTFDLKKV